MANTLMEVGSVDHGVVVHGCGLDEISPLGSSTIVEIKAIKNNVANSNSTNENKKKYTKNR